MQFSITILYAVMHWTSTFAFHLPFHLPLIHLSFNPPFSRLPGSNKQWEAHVYAMGERWKKTIVKWYGSARRLNIPILVVHYEDVQRDHLKQVVRILDFLDFSYGQTEVEAALVSDFDDVRRKHKEKYEHYTNQQKHFVRSIIESTIEALESIDASHEELKLNRYLHTNSSYSTL